VYAELAKLSKTFKQQALILCGWHQRVALVEVDLFASGVQGLIKIFS